MKPAPWYARLCRNRRITAAARVAILSWSIIGATVAPVVGWGATKAVEIFLQMRDDLNRLARFVDKAEVMFSERERRLYSLETEVSRETDFAARRFDDHERRLARLERH
jgi:hypothetical protein